jgi:hypothetical protein
MVSDQEDKEKILQGRIITSAEIEACALLLKINITIKYLCDNMTVGNIFKYPYLNALWDIEVFRIGDCFMTRKDSQ